jgi:sulfite exporter TauE/SafE
MAHGDFNMIALTDSILILTLYIFVLGTSLYLLGYGIYAGLIKKRMMNNWAGSAAIGIGAGFILAGLLGLFACQYYWDGFRESLKVLSGS